MFGDVEGEDRTSRFGHEGYAQLAEGLQISSVGAGGDRDEVDEVIEGGDGTDLSGIAMGFASARDGDGVDDVEEAGDSELLLYSASIFSCVVGWGERKVAGAGNVGVLGQSYIFL